MEQRLMIRDWTRDEGSLAQPRQLFLQNNNNIPNIAGNQHQTACTASPLVSTAPTPDKTVDKGVPQVTVTVVPIPLAPYPDSPYTNEFQYINHDDSKDEDKTARTTIHNAFALESIANTDDTTFNRWFPEDVDVPGRDNPIDARGYVSGVFRQLLQACATSPAANQVIINFVNDKNDYSKEPRGPTTEAYFTASINTFHV
jgi:hypothetical protein